MSSAVTIMLTTKDKLQIYSTDEEQILSISLNINEILNNNRSFAMFKMRLDRGTPRVDTSRIDAKHFKITVDFTYDFPMDIIIWGIRLITDNGWVLVSHTKDSRPMISPKAGRSCHSDDMFIFKRETTLNSGIST